MVELPDALITGLIHVSSLTDDFYSFQPAQRQLVGRRSKKRFGIGSEVRVFVVARIRLSAKWTARWPIKTRMTALTNGKRWWRVKKMQQPLWHRLWKEFLSIEKLVRLLNRSVSSDAYRVGLVGCGRVARRHLYGYVKTGKAQVVAASDPSSKQREKGPEALDRQHLWGF